MREIKFRGKTANGEWAYGSLVYSKNIQPAIYFEVGKGSVKTFDFVYVRPETVGQFTGLHDKHGVEIFEGDVLSYEDVAGVKDGIGNVLFGLFYGAWIVFVDDYEENPLSDVAYSCEVIGKIHDNPELQEVGE